MTTWGIQYAVKNNCREALPSSFVLPTQEDELEKQQVSRKPTAPSLSSGGQGTFRFIHRWDGLMTTWGIQ